VIHIKRVYEEPSKEDGFRVLVDRLWPRGLTKIKAKVDLWMKDVAPSDALRNEFHQEKVTWPQFEKRYLTELAKKKGLLAEIRKLEKEHGTVSLVYGRNDEKQNQAVIIAGALKAKK